jgi:hypothetical protein
MFHFPLCYFQAHFPRKKLGLSLYFGRIFVSFFSLAKRKEQSEFYASFGNFKRRFD